ncbi:hypothetical protein ACXR0O_00635 [Verrucomicrobiota bacterium sgz303538]
MPDPISRRAFLRDVVGLAAGGVIASPVFSRAAEENASFRSCWDKTPDGRSLSPVFLANPVQDWRVAAGRLECVKAASDQTVQLLTHEIGEAPGGDVRMSVRIGRVGGGAWGSAEGSAGFRIGIQKPLREYPNRRGSAQGLDVGVTGRGELFIGQPEKTDPPHLSSTEPSELELRVKAEPADGGYKVTFSVHDPRTGKALGEIVRDLLPAEQFVGKVALVTNFAATGVGEVWFADWLVVGTKVVENDGRASGNP